MAPFHDSSELSDDLYNSLCNEFPVFAMNFLPKFDNGGPGTSTEEELELVLRDPLRPDDFQDVLEALRRLGQHADAQTSLRSAFLYKDYVSRLSLPQQTQLYETLGDALGPQLTEFNLSFLKLSIASLALLLRKMPRLETLYLGRVALLQRSEALQLYSVLMKLKQLQEFHWSWMVAPESLFQMEENDNNDNNDLQQNNHNNPAAAAAFLDPLLVALAQIPTLQTLYLAAHRPQGGRLQSTIALSALSKSSVNDLTLVNCPLTTAQLSSLLADGGKSFTSLALLQAEIGDAGAKIIVEQGLLAQDDTNNTNNTLKKLFLQGNHLSNSGGNAIATALRDERCCRLQVLDLHNNQLTASFGKCMGITLQSKTQSLQFLDVSHNPLGDKGGIALAAALTHNTQLTQLHMFKNQISDKTCAVLAVALQSNRHLKQVNLYENPNISAQGIHSLLDRVEEENYVLERLEVSTAGYSNSKDTQDALDFVLTLNRKYGRQYLMSTQHEKQYLEQGVVKATAKDDLNSLFYFLKMKPTLCQQNEENDAGCGNRATSSSSSSALKSQTIARAALQACCEMEDGM